MPDEKIIEQAKVVIIPYEAWHQPWFEKFNRAWIEKFFWMEEVDEYVLTKPEEAIINKGGAILMALINGQPAGTVALKKVNEDTFEFTKMAVDESYRRRGIAEQLSMAAIEMAGNLGADRIILYSQTGLQPAITLYRKLGFIEVPLEEGTYERSDIKMEMNLNKK